MEKEALIQQALDFQIEINALVTGYSYENLLSQDLSIGQLKSLIYLYSADKASHRDLAGVLNVAPPVVTGIVDRLVAQGLVKRMASTVDRRVHWLTLTEKGRDIFDCIKKHHNEEARAILSTLNKEDIQALIQGVSSLLKATKQYLDATNRALGPKSEADTKGFVIETHAVKNQNRGEDFEHVASQ